MEDYIEEITLVEVVADIDHGPKYITHASQKAGPDLPCPNGGLHFIVMSRVPGEDLNDIYDSLNSDQLESIRSQLAYILE